MQLFITFYFIANIVLPNQVLVKRFSFSELSPGSLNFLNAGRRIILQRVQSFKSIPLVFLSFTYVRRNPRFSEFWALPKVNKLIGGFCCFSKDVISNLEKN